MTDVLIDALPLTLVLPYLAGGVIAGFVTGLLGVGGGWLFVPLSLWVLAAHGYDNDTLVPVAVGTSLIAVTMASLLSAINHARRRAFDAVLLKRWAPFVILGGLTGGGIAEFVPGDVVKLIFAVMMFRNAIVMMRQKTRVKPLSQSLPVTGSIGYGVGLVASLIGIGGGALATPVMQAMHVPMRHAIGTAAALNICLALPAGTAYVIQGLNESGLPVLSLGYISLPALMCIVPTALAAVPLGVRLSHLLDVNRLKRLFGMFLLLVSLKMAHAVIVSAMGW